MALWVIAAVLAVAAVSGPTVLAGDVAKTGSAVRGPKANFPREWFWASEEKDWNELQKLAGTPAKPLTLKNWRGEPQDLAKLKGKIVVIDFWATWCGPCKAVIPTVNDLAQQHKDSGVVVFGVCCSDGANIMEKTAEKHDMRYPTAADVGKRSANAYGVRWWPFFVLIDRDGVIRAAGLTPGHLGDAIEALLVEQPAGT